MRGHSWSPDINKRSHQSSTDFSSPALDEKELYDDVKICERESKKANSGHFPSRKPESRNSRNIYANQEVTKAEQYAALEPASRQLTDEEKYASLSVSKADYDKHYIKIVGSGQ